MFSIDVLPERTRWKRREPFLAPLGQRREDDHRLQWEEGVARTRFGVAPSCLAESEPVDRLGGRL